MIKFILFFIILALGLALISTVLSIIATPAAWIGIGITLFGFYQLRQKNKGKLTFSKPSMIIGAGILLTIILGLSFAEPNNEAKTEEKVVTTDNIEGQVAENEETKIKKEPSNVVEEEPKIKKVQYDVVWGTYDNEWVYSDEWTGEGFENFNEAVNVLDQCMSDSEYETEKCVYDYLNNQ